MTEIKWLTIAEASLLASETGLDRTHKTIRSWCRKGDVIAEKQTTRTGDRWVADRESLITKINFELELKEQESRTMSEQVQTSADRFEPVRTSSDQYENSEPSKYNQSAENKTPDRGEPNVNPSSNELEQKVRSLEIEVKFNEELMNEFKRQYLKGQETLHAQARYIGHLESDLLRLGETPNEKFLAAPQPKAYKPMKPSAEIANVQRPHSHQGAFYENHSG